ncbi:phage tail tape measure protein [Streptomyces nymphaeiformis]|uniref:TP901 family phage tail tape measure protein n=1 Tax=Streptomyces nymphaeiformis TaxID=2663842 RepID=A0A7W7XDR7_9ACTN|nr:phage tail tape measure protein [Streptomyces nymphaeiformis]MBB4985039.1 TP901 family phage tail tape measure protein [Streptomyces nymphaeiformis]
MADRTVRVVLTGNVGPYVSAMRTAASQTQVSARQIATSSQAAANNSSRAFQRMGNTATTQAGRAAAAVNRATARTSAQMNQMASRSAGAMNQMSRSATAASRQAANSSSAAFQQMARMAQTQGARAATSLNASFASTRAQAAGLGAEGAAALNRVGASAISAGSAMRTSMTSAAAASTQAINSTSAALARMSALTQTGAVQFAAALNASSGATAAQMAGLGAASALAMNRATSASVQAAAAVRSAGTASSAAAATTSSRWASAWMALSGGARFAAHTVGTSMMNVANTSEKSLKATRNASLGLAAVFALAAAAAARFDKAMSEVRAVTNGSADDMKSLSDAALEAGQATVFSATEAANAEAELARAGISTADIIGGALRGALDLAASGQLELGESAIISAQAMNAFKLRGQDVGHIADVISAGAGKSATNVHHMGMAFRQAALLSSQTGLTLEQTVGTLSLFAQNALTGSDAGTSLKVMLQRLVPQSAEAAAMMEQIGFKAYDAQGEFIGLTALAGNMAQSFSKLTPEARNAAMATIFGSDAVRAATILYEAGSQGVDQWVGAVNDTGYATRVAATMTDNLAGDLERLKGSLETALIQSGSGANAVLREMAQALNAVVGWYSQLSPSAQKSLTVMAGLLGVLGLVGSSLLLMLPRIMAVRTELVALGVTAARVRTAMLALGRLSLVVMGIAAVSYGVNKLTEGLREAPPNATRLSNALVDLAQKGKAAGELTKAFGDNLDGFGEAVARIAHPGALDRISDFFSELDPFGPDGFGDLIAARDKVKALDEALAGLVQGGATKEAAAAFAQMAAEAEKQGTSTAKLRTLLPQYSDALTALDTQNKLSVGSQKDLADATGMTADQMADTRSQAEKLTDALKTLNGVAISVAEKEISFRSALSELTDAAKENGFSLDIASEKGRKVKSAFLDAAQAAMSHAEAVAEQQGTIEAGNAVLEQDIALLRRQMDQAGFSAEAIDKLIGAYAKLPSDASTTVSAPGATNATAELQALYARLAALPQGKTLTIKAPTGAAIAELQALGYKVERLPGGQVKISAPTGAAISALNALQTRVDVLDGRVIDITTHYRTTGSPYPPSGGRANREADGGLIRGYASGGDVQWMPWGGAVYGPGTETSDSVPTWLSRGEYVIKAASVRKYGIGMFDRLNAGRYASGGLLGGSFSYTPTGRPVLGGPTDAKARYDWEIENLKKQWEELTKALADQAKAAADLKAAEENLKKVRKDKKHTKKQLQDAEDRVTKARSTKSSADARVKKERKDVDAGTKELGLKAGSKAPATFNLAAYATQLDESLAVTERWRKNLAWIGKRGGRELQAMLEAMGTEGQDLVNALATASDKQFKDIADKLKKTGDLAKATLADFTNQLGGATKESQQFAADLQKLAAQGFGDLAQALAAQGDATAMTLAHEAAGNKTAAAAANKAVGQAQNTLTGEDLANSLVLLSTLRSAPGKGYADLVNAGLDMAVIKKLVPRMMGQINALPEAYKSVFLKQWAGQGGVVAMARGGILTRPSLVLGGEAGVPESWIPHDGSARSRALLARTAARMGYQLTPAARYRGTAQAAGGVGTTVTRHYEVHLHGAKQSTAEQAMDVARHMSLIG